ncbi:uncharacterized protein BDZ99DRAFT_380610 [Mytilinidion resinicola]|uniref:Uncharacterized protein n=1 Tax=Mytilinidion resinicola TaxID=574789 RepID=A0A6A6YZN7_9PEZI|nr:uncharacterized protein BDZ99DRAFT_380610 [Mytilinidion resinicola]KAF2814382.1 hypothetical protein BDZ99DRAFT_380610 [Mytilinidion resinicola]
MCVAELNVSILPCRHRWYHLVRPCTPSANLSNCGDKLALSGWEIKCDFCPYCSGWNLTSSEYRLVGNDRTPSVGGLSRSPSLSLSSTRRESRRGSLARTDSSTSVTMMAAQEKNRALNARVDAYLRVTPEHMVMMEPKTGEDEADGVGGPPSTSDSDKSEGQGSSAHSEAKGAGLFGKGWKKSKRFSRTLFK